MIKDAEQYAEEDRRRKEEVETRNQADGVVYATEKFLSENGDKVPDDVKTEVQADVDALKAALENTEEGSISAIESALAKLNESSQKMGSAMYAAGEADAAAAGGTTGTGDSDEDVVDAEIVDEPTDEGNEGDAK
jgi:molecular chaperone DnaK